MLTALAKRESFASTSGFCPCAGNSILFTAAAVNCNATIMIVNGVNFPSNQFNLLGMSNVDNPNRKIGVSGCKCNFSGRQPRIGFNNCALVHTVFRTGRDVKVRICVAYPHTNSTVDCWNLHTLLPLLYYFTSITPFKWAVKRNRLFQPVVCKEGASHGRLRMAQSRQGVLPFPRKLKTVRLPLGIRQLLLEHERPNCPTSWLAWRP